jgi:hypothetical protein
MLDVRARVPQIVGSSDTWLTVTTFASPASSTRVLTVRRTALI